MTSQTEFAMRFGGARQIHQLGEFARRAPSDGLSLNYVEEACDSLACWPAPTTPGAPSRPAAARAALIVGDLIELEYRAGARDVLRAVTPDFLAKAGGDPISAARLAMERYHEIVEPAQVAEAFGLVWAYDYLEVVQQAASGDERAAALLDAEEAALRTELAEYAHLVAKRAAPDILRDLPDGEDFRDALLTVHPLVTPFTAADVAKRTLRLLAEPPTRRYAPDAVDPWTSPWEGPSEIAIGLHQKAVRLAEAPPPALGPETSEEWRERLEMACASREQAAGMNAADLMSIEFPDIEWIVPGYLTEGLTLLAGAPKIGKSWLVLGLALAVASGGKAFGEIECERGTVLYLALEDNFRRLQSRLRLMGVTAGPAGLHFQTTWPSVDEGCVAQMAAWLDNHANTRMIVVDVFAKIKSAKGGNRPQYEIDYKDVTALQRLALDRGISIVLVHHTRKAEADGDPFDLVSGTRGLTGSADSTFVLTQGSGQGQPSLYGRGRDIMEIEQAMTFDPASCRWSIAGPVVEFQASPERREILTVLRQAGEPMQLANIAEAVQKSSSNVSNMLGKMVAAGTVRKVSTGLYEIAPPPTRPWSEAPL